MNSRRILSHLRGCATAATCPKKCERVIPTVKKAVIISTSKDIYRNLALEHWFYKNYKFTQNHLLMLWVNEPCVVIGRHQNPWAECNVPWLISNAIPLARRNSGGGTVYHDAGNLNLTFFTPNEHYHRRTNLEFISNAVYKQHGLRMEINKREDLAVRDYKVSGTAAKLARHCAYHHCTLLINADTTKLRTALLPTEWNITTNATKSIKSKILNLQEECKDITVENLIKSIAKHYLEWNNTNLYAGDANKNTNHCLKSLEMEPVTSNGGVSMESLKAQIVTPSESVFPGIDAIYEDYKSWNWTFGKTPKFAASKIFKGATSKQSGGEQKVYYTTSRTYAFELAIQIENGIISEIDVKVPSGYHDGQILQRLQDAQAVIGQKYDVELIKRIENVFKTDDDNVLHQTEIAA